MVDVATRPASGIFSKIHFPSNTIDVPRADTPLTGPRGHRTRISPLPRRNPRCATRPGGPTHRQPGHSCPGPDAPSKRGPAGNAVADSIVTFLRSMGPRPVFACTRAGGPCYRNVAKRDLKIRYGVSRRAGTPFRPMRVSAGPSGLRIVLRTRNRSMNAPANDLLALRAKAHGAKAHGAKAHGPWNVDCIADQQRSNNDRTPPKSPLTTPKRSMTKTTQSHPKFFSKKIDVPRESDSCS